MAGLVDRLLPASCTQEVSKQAFQHQYKVPHFCDAHTYEGPTFMLWLQDVKGGTVEQCVLAELMNKRHARLMCCFARMDYSLAELTASWFNNLFTCTLPPETTVRVWDCLMCEGPKILFRVAMAAIKV